MATGRWTCCSSARTSTTSSTSGRTRRLARFLDRLAGFARLIVMDRRGSGLVGRRRAERRGGARRRRRGARRRRQRARGAVLLHAPAGRWRRSSPRAIRERVVGARPVRLHAARRARRRPALAAGRGRARRALRRARRALGHGREHRRPRAERGRRRGPAGVVRAPRAARRAARAACAGSCAAFAEFDPRPELAAISVPTLVLHRTDDAFVGRAPLARVRAPHPGRAVVELPGADSLPSAGDSDALLGEIEEFLTGGRRGAEREPRAADGALQRHRRQHRSASRRSATSAGATCWPRTRATCGARCAASTARSSRARATASWRSSRARRAARCAARRRCARASRGSDWRCACGLHTGECEIIGDGIGGMAVHIAARVGALAQGGEILVSGTTYGDRRRLPACDFDGTAASTASRACPARWPVFALQRREAVRRQAAARAGALGGRSRTTCVAAAGAIARRAPSRRRARRYIRSQRPRARTNRTRTPAQSATPA